MFGASGTGKGAAVGVAEELTPLPEYDEDGLPADDFATFSVGSGEGMLRTLVTKVSSKPVEMKQTRFNVGFRVDEGSMLTNLAKRQDQTTVATLCSMWSGEARQQLRERREDLPRRQARVPRVADSEHPTRRRGLPAQRHGNGGSRGSASRISPRSTRTCRGRRTFPRGPARVAWEPYRLPDPSQATLFTVCDRIQNTIRDMHWRRTTGADTDEARAHVALRCLKIAAALALLEGRIDINVEDWELACMVEQTSTLVRHAALRDLAAPRQAQDTAYAWRQGQRQVVASTIQADQHAANVESAAKIIRNRCNRPGAPPKRKDLRDAARPAQTGLPP